MPTNEFDMSKYPAPEIADKDNLKLVTVNGRYNVVTGAYDSHLVVFAQQNH